MIRKLSTMLKIRLLRGNKLYLLAFVMVVTLTFALIKFRDTSVPAVDFLEPHNMPRDHRLQTLAESSTILVEPDFSHQPPHPDPGLVVFIQSHANHHTKRQLIRDTWGDTEIYKKHQDPNLFHSDMPVFIVFVIGHRPDALDRVRDESAKHKDILLLSMGDSYDNLVVKGLLAMTWISRRFPRSAVMKTDDDILLDLFTWRRVADSVLSGATAPCSVLCQVWSTPWVHRKGKYAVSEDQFPFVYYPSFCSGMAYLVTPDALTAIVDAAKFVPLYLRDDVYFTGIAARSTGVTLLDMGNRHTTGIVDSPENLNPDCLLAIHQANSTLWQSLWQRMIDKSGQQRLSCEITATAVQETGRGMKVAPSEKFATNHKEIMPTCRSDYADKTITIS